MRVCWVRLFVMGLRPGDRTEEAERVVSERFESVAVVKRRCPLMDGVGEEADAADGGDRSPRRLDSVGEQDFPEAFSLCRSIDGQAREQDATDSARQSPLGRHVFGIHLAWRECVVAQNPLGLLVREKDPRARVVLALLLQRHPHEPVI